MEVFLTSVIHRPGLVIRLTVPKIGPLRIEIPTVIRVSRGR